MVFFQYNDRRCFGAFPKRSEVTVASRKFIGKHIRVRKVRLNFVFPEVKAFFHWYPLKSRTNICHDELDGFSLKKFPDVFPSKKGPSC